MPLECEGTCSAGLKLQTGEDWGSRTPSSKRVKLSNQAQTNKNIYGKGKWRGLSKRQAYLSPNTRGLSRHLANEKGRSPEGGGALYLAIQGCKLRRDWEQPWHEKHRQSSFSFSLTPRREARREKCCWEGWRKEQRGSLCSPRRCPNGKQQPSTCGCPSIVALLAPRQTGICDWQFGQGF